MNGFSNFTKVLVRSLLNPIKIVILILGLVFGVSYGSLGLIVLTICVAGIAVLVSRDLTDQKFIESALKPQSSDQKSIQIEVQEIIKEQIQKIKTVQFSPNLQLEVNKDLVTARTTLTKMMDTVGSVPNSAATSLEIIKTQLPSIIDTLVELCQEEQKTRLLLKKDDPVLIEKGLQELLFLQNQVQDSEAKSHYDQAITLKKEQLSVIAGLQSKIPSIDSALARINATLEQSSAYVSKATLPDQQSRLGIEEEILSKSLQQIDQLSRTID